MLVFKGVVDVYSLWLTIGKYTIVDMDPIGLKLFDIYIVQKMRGITI